MSIIFSSSHLRSGPDSRWPSPRIFFSSALEFVDHVTCPFVADRDCAASPPAFLIHAKPRRVSCCCCSVTVGLIGNSLPAVRTSRRICRPGRPTAYGFLPQQFFRPREQRFDPPCE